MTRSRPTLPGRRGVTLIEMLVVVVILVVMVGIGLPLLGPAMEGRRVRESARMVQIYFSAARARAMATGQPAGVTIVPFGVSLPQCAMMMKQAEVPPPYGGGSTNAAFRLQVTGYASSVVTMQATIEPAGSFNDGIVCIGDRVQLNYQGPLYTIRGPAAADSDADGFIDTGPFTLELDLGNGLPPPPWPTTVGLGPSLPWPSVEGVSAPVPYTIHRRPIPAALAPLQLPAGAVVDLQFTGFFDRATNTMTGGTPQVFGLGTTDPITILFSPSGALSEVRCGAAVNNAMAPICVMVGKREKTPWVDTNGNGAQEPAVGDLMNWSDFDNYWIAISPQTGLVTTTQVASTNSLADSLEFALTAQSTGGR